jgi:MoaA/NifB/PqqE/SkfB family radical SAM enzyme
MLKLTDLRCYEGIVELDLDKGPVCSAPYSNLYFDYSGKISTCCVNRTYPIGNWPNSTIKEAWFGEKRKKIMEALNNYNFKLGCSGCYDQIILKNNNAFATHFQSYPYGEYPLTFDFECCRMCNSECIMCTGSFSSAIRANREKMPPLKTPYDDRFVSELEEFIPNLQCVRFVGGEPFLSPLYYKIWNKIAELNKNLKIEVTSNCSICDDRVRNVLMLLPNFTINASLDSLNKNTYETIRRKLEFEKVIKNVNYFLEQKRLSSVSVCPMIQNIWELPDIVKFCENNNIDFRVNTVTGPLSAYTKGIHNSPHATQAKVWNGETYEDLPDNFYLTEREKVPEFTLATLSKTELSRIKKMLEKLEIDCVPNNRSKITGIKMQVISFIGHRIRNSRSYRIGRLITWLPRKIRDFFQWRNP